LRLLASLSRLFSLAALRSRLTPSYSLPDLLAISLTAAVVTIWAALAAGRFSLLAFVAIEAVFLLFYLAGSLVAAWRPLADATLFDLPLRLMVGYAVVNTALFVLAWVSPLGIIAHFALLLIFALLLFIAAQPSRQPTGRLKDLFADDKVGILVLGLGLIATTLWCQDSIRPTSVQDDIVVFKPWIDSFYHAVHIRIFGAGHGAATIEDFRLAGIPARLYHYGIYLTPAFIRQASGISLFAAYAGVLAPLGVLFTGLGAYALVGSVWGRWAGLAACAALFVLPDGSQQGVHNPFMSYHWLTQISPSATYGLMLLSLAWIFVIRACQQGRWRLLLLGWLGGGLLLIYKAHFFIASAVPLVLLPAIFFRAPLARWKRATWLAGSLVAIVLTAHFANRIPGVPLIRFDGSSLRTIMGHITNFTVPGPLKTTLFERLGTSQSLLSNLVLGTPFVLLAALGLLLPLSIVLAILVRKQTPRMFLLFPFVIIANFLAMFLGLALDMRSSTPDELSHRPVMVVYFMVATWVGGAAGLLLLQSRRLSRMARPALLGLALVLMIVPAIFGSGIHRMWALASISPPLRVPRGLVEAAHYIREHSDPQELIQDSLFDRFCTVAALSERKAFVARSQTRIMHNADLVEQRVEMVENFVSLKLASEIPAMARQLGIRWFLLTRGNRVSWPEEIANHPAFESDGYKVYRF
jgi:hypothetical protein